MVRDEDVCPRRRMDEEDGQGQGRGKGSPGVGRRTGVEFPKESLQKEFLEG